MKRCSACKRRTTNFGSNKTRSDGLQDHCRDCRSSLNTTRYRQTNKRRLAKWYAANKERVSAENKRRYRQDPTDAKARARTYRERYPERKRAQDQKYAKQHPLRKRFTTVKANAKKRQIPFQLTWNQFALVMSITHCPVCKVRMKLGGKRGEPNIVSIDRLDSAGAYTVGNCAAICYKCNLLKGLATWQELLALAHWLKQQVAGRKIKPGWHKWG